MPPAFAALPTPGMLLLTPWRLRLLFWQLVQRDVLARYRGSLLGLLWSFATPLLMLAVYTFVFSVVFQARWGGAAAPEGGGRLEFAILLFAGLIVFNLFAECINKAPGLVLGHASYVKRVVFPLHVLPWVSLGSALFHALISLLVLLLAMLVDGRVPGLMALWLPLVLLPFGLMILGLSWLLAALGVYLRDIGQVVGLMLTALMFLSPIFYPASALPESVRAWLALNPLSLIIEQLRRVLVWNQAPDWLGLGVYTLVALLVAWLGLAFFEKVRRGFADVL